MQRKYVKGLGNLIKTPWFLGQLDLICVVVLKWACGIHMHGFLIFKFSHMIKNESFVREVSCILHGINALCRMQCVEVILIYL